MRPGVRRCPKVASWPPPSSSHSWFAWARSRASVQTIGVCRLKQRQRVGCGVVVEHLCIAPPFQRRLNLPLDVRLGKMLVQDVTEELNWNLVVGLMRQHTAHLLQ